MCTSPYILNYLVTEDECTLSCRTVATYQTLLQPTRLAKFDPKFLKAVIVDEAHHAAAPS